MSSVTPANSDLRVMQGFASASAASCHGRAPAVHLETRVGNAAKPPKQRAGTGPAGLPHGRHGLVQRASRTTTEIEVEAP